VTLPERANVKVVLAPDEPFQSVTITIPTASAFATESAVA